MNLENVDRNDNCFGVVGAELGSFAEFSRVENGGAGSGNFGHSGRPGNMNG